MNQTADWRATHQALSEQDLRFREMALGSPELLSRSSFQALEQNKDLLMYRLQPWPTFLGPEKLAELRRVSVGVFNLLASVPQRIFGGDPARLAEFYRLGPARIAELLFSPPSGIETAVSRGDLIETADGFKCIEFNFTPNLGGWETSLLVGMHLSVPATAAAVRELGIQVRYTDTVLQLFLHLLADLERKGLLDGGELTFAFTTRHQPLGPADPEVVFLEREIARALAAAGRGDLRGRAVVCRYGALTGTPEGVFHEGRRVQAILEFAFQLAPEPIYRAFKAGKVSLLNGPLEPVLSTKRNVALLSQHAESAEIFDAEERAFIARHVPWTRLVTPGPVNFAGERSSSLEDLLIARQESLVLKEASSNGGKGVVLGRFATAEEWRATVGKALAQDGAWVVQEQLESLPYLYQSGDQGCEIHDVIWGPFVFAGSYAGVILRMQPKASGGAVNLSLHATEGIVVEV
jgi:hypothetical protein